MSILGTYTINLDCLNFYAHIGVSEEERNVGTNIIVNVSAEAEATNAAFIEDNFKGAPDYATVYREVLKISKEPIRLLEHFAYKAACARVTVIKLNPPIGADGLKASVTLNLSREQYKKLNMLK